MRPDICKVELIGNGFLAVMAKPDSGERIEDEFLGIANEGVNQIVSLLEAHEAYELGLQNEKFLSERNGIEFISFPIKDRGLPKSVSEFSKFTRELNHQIAGGKNTVVHCHAGIGRTGIVAAGILLHCGFGPDKAFKHISLKRRIQVLNTIEQYIWVTSNYNAIVNNT